MAETTNKSTPRAVLLRRTGYMLAPTQTAIKDSTKVSWTDTFTGSKNPNWRDQIRRVVSATTAANGFRRRIVVTTGSGESEWWTSATKTSVYYRKNVMTAYVPLHDLSVTVSSPSAVTANNQAIERLYQRLSSFESSAQAGEDLGEISQTLKMLRSPLRPIRRELVKVIKHHKAALNMRTAKSSAKALADTVLEYRFGVVPLVNTLTDGILGLKDRDYMAYYYPFYAKGEDKKAGTRTYNDGFGNRAIVTDVSKVISEVVTYNGVWGVRAGVDRRAVNDVLSLRWKDVVPTIWNLIPYSFLADYFTNVGTITQSMSVPWNGVRWCVKISRAESRYHATASKWYPISPAFYYTESLSPGSVEVFDVTFSRSNVQSLPRPSLQLQWPTGRQWQNIAALAISGGIPLLGALTKKAVKRMPDLPNAFANEVGRRDIKAPYPFHL